MDRNSKLSGAWASSRTSSSTRTGTSMRLIAWVPGAMRSRSRAEWAPATCRDMRLPAFCGDEQATAKTRAWRRRDNSSASSGCGSINTPLQPSCSRCQVCDRCCGRLAPTSTKNPERAPPKNCRTSACSFPSSTAAGTDDCADFRNRLAGLQRARLAHDLARAEAGEKINEDHLAAIGFDQLAAHDFIPSVVSAFHENLRTHVPDQLDRRILLEHDNQIDRLDRGEHLGARMLVLHRPVLALQPRDRCVAVQADHQPVAGRVGFGQELDMAGMQDIEAAVGEADAKSAAVPLSYPLVQDRPVEYD